MGAKPTSRSPARTSEFDPKRTSIVQAEIEQSRVAATDDGGRMPGIPTDGQFLGRLLGGAGGGGFTTP